MTLAVSYQLQMLLRQAGATPGRQNTWAEGYPLAWPKPRAQNASERSSMHGTILARGCMAAAAVRGEDLEPVQGT